MTSNVSPARRLGSGRQCLGRVVFWLGFFFVCHVTAGGGIRVGASAVEFRAEDSMVIAGGIGPGKAKGQEGKLRAVATVFEKNGVKVGLVACDLLMMTRATLDPVVREISEATGISPSHLMINCTHTHHAPSTMRIHDYDLDPEFTKHVQHQIVDAVKRANQCLEDSEFYFGLGMEETVGQNSRQLLDDGMIYWIGPRDGFVRATGPFDPELPVFGFKGKAGNWRAVWFNHSTHTIGTRNGAVRSPSFYGLAAQELESEFGGVFGFLEGASGSTHNLNLSGEECTRRIRKTVEETLSGSQKREVESIASVKRSVSFRVRHFNEAAEDAAVARYCRKYAPGFAEYVIQVFRTMRSELASHQGEERETWVQALRIGDVALVGVPAEYFTQLGVDIKNRSPFRYTYVAELANDWVGYLPNLEGHKLGGYQVWTGHHSYAEPGTGERIADVAVELLHELASTEGK